MFTRDHERRSPRSARIDAGVFAAVIVAAAIDLAQPLEGDQSLFLVFAKRMASGAVLYRDLWDLKQPGIFLFYELAGRLGGFEALSVHALEAAWLVAFAIVVRVALGRWPAFEAGARAGPLLVVAWYAVVARSPQQAQVEALAGFPIFVSAWLACEGARTRGSRVRFACYVGSGVTAGLAVLFKLLFAPMLLAIFIFASLRPAETAARRVAPALAGIAAYGIGAALPVAVTLVALGRAGALRAALETWLVVPPQIVATIPAQPAAVLVAALVWFAASYGAVVALAVIPFAAACRDRFRDPLARALAVWLVSGLFTFLAQRTSWWEYQLLLVSAPLGAFASAGVVALARAPRRPSHALALAVTAVLAVVPVRTEISKIAQLAKHGFAVGSADRERYRAGVSPSTYALARADAHLVAPGSSLYVMGNPVFYVATDTTQALVLNGWSMELLIASQRAELLREFQAGAPRYVFVTAGDRGPAVFMARSPAFAAYFAARYAVVARGHSGTLYRYRTPVRAGVSRAWYTHAS